MQSLIYEYKQKKPCELIQYIEQTVINEPAQNEQKMEAENYQQDFSSLDKVDSGNSPMAGNNSDEARQDP